MEYYGESASSFAEKISVQRSSISHILSGRNKPSLEFVLKILTTFPEVELYWLLNGKGEFPAQEKTTEQIKAPTLPPVENIQKSLNIKTDSNDPNKTIERIIIFYSDGSFKNYQN